LRQPSTDIPGLVVRGRVAFLPADIDRRYSRESLPDYAALLANLVRWSAENQLPLEVEGPGLLDCNAYTQQARVVVHIVNLTATGWMPVDELVPVGPVRVRVKLPGGARTAGRAMAATPSGKGIPWHRVLGERGKILIRDPYASLQRKLLESEGVTIVESRVDLKRHLWKPPRKIAVKYKAPRKRISK